MDNKKNPPNSLTTNPAKPGLKSPKSQEELRRQIIDHLEKSSDEIELNDDEEEVLFYLAMKIA